MLPRMKLASTILLLALMFSFMPAGSASAATACYQAKFISETIPDGSSYAPGTPFKKTWRLQNIGTCDWTGIALVFDSGEKMGAPDSGAISTTVAPSKTVDITVDLTAPNTPATYTGFFKLKSSTGEKFGIGPAAAGSFWVKINVTSTGSSAGYDFIAEAAKATWTNSTGKVLTFPGTDGDVLGFATVGLHWIYEDYSSPMSSMLVSPDNVANGYVQGVYPAFKVQTGDRFRALIGCELSATSCYVRYRLLYKVGTDPALTTLLDFREKWEGRTYPAVVNLDRLAGKEVNFVLEVSAYGPPTGDRALWGDTVITRSGTPPPAACTDRAKFVSDGDVPDGRTFTPGEAFIKTWKIKNIGTCTWTTAYSMIYDHDEKMSGSDPLAFPKSIAPGEVMDIPAKFIAPTTPGTYTGYWKFKNNNGVAFGLVPFGIGNDNQKAFWVKIKVSGTATGITPTITVTPTTTPTPTAKPVSCPPAPQGWVSVVVAAGDTLESLAAKYKTTAEILRMTNCLTSTSLTAGAVLYVPPVAP